MFMFIIEQVTNQLQERLLEDRLNPAETFGQFGACQRKFSHFLSVPGYFHW